MSKIRTEIGFATINNARIYYEIAGERDPFVMIHAGVADSRQWNNEFGYFEDRFQVLRYDMRGYGNSEPVEGDYNNLDDLVALLNYLHIDLPCILMGCSMGGGLAMDFALSYPARVKALIMVGSGPTGLDLNVPEPAKFEAWDKAYDAGDLDLAAELGTQIWFDGMGRTPEQVDPLMRRLTYDMGRMALSHEAKKLGKRLPNAEVSGAARLNQLKAPLLVIVGEHDIPYILAAADYMVEKIPSARKVTIKDAAHLANMDHPEEFKQIISEFLEGVIL
jgi:pimeloyl-ACP methyl ester carboxylesterase